jgi:hypothetical protein
MKSDGPTISGVHLPRQLRRKWLARLLLLL